MEIFKANGKTALAQISIEYEPRDIWIGLYWNVKEYPFMNYYNLKHIHIYICIIPLFPIHFTISRKVKRYK